MAMAMATGSSSRSARSLIVVLAWTLLCFVITGVAARDAPIGAPSTGALSLSPSSATPSSAQPALWADQEARPPNLTNYDCGFNLMISGSSSLSQYVRSDFGGDPKRMVLSELKVMKVMKVM